MPKVTVRTMARGGYIYYDVVACIACGRDHNGICAVPHKGYLCPVSLEWVRVKETDNGADQD